MTLHSISVLITFDADLRLQLSKELKFPTCHKRTVAECFAAYEGESLQLPKDAVLTPTRSFLELHRTKSASQVEMKTKANLPSEIHDAGTRDDFRRL